VGASVLWQTRPLETAESGTLVRCDEPVTVIGFAISKKGLIFAIFKFSRAQRVEPKCFGREIDVKQLAKGMDNTTIS